MNRFKTTEARVEKLLAQYNKHKSLVIGVDFDFTLYDPEHGFDMELVALLLDAQKLNCKLCLWTANYTRLTWILGKCYEINLHFDHLNTSPIKIGTEVIKPHFNVLLDDTAGLGQSIEILEQTLTKIKELK